MKRNYIIILIAFCSIILNSCEDDIKLEIPNPEPKIVIHGIISPDSKIMLDVRKSISVLDRNHVNWTNQQIENADFKLFKNMQFIDNLSVDSSNKLVYCLNYTNFNEGETITLQGKAGTYPSITANVSIPFKPDFTVSNLVYSKTNNQINNISFNINLNDKLKNEDFYAISVLDTNVIYGIYSQIILPKSNDPSIKFIYSTYFLNDKLFNGFTKIINLIINSDDFNLSQSHPKDTIWVECKTLSKDYYNYLITTNKQNLNERDLYAEPVNVTNNIEGGYGILGAVNYSRTRIILNYEGN